MANLILTWEKINSWGGTTYTTDVKRCPTKSEVVAKGLQIPYTASNNQLIYNVTRTVYSNITINSVSVSDIPASGGTITSGTVTYSQTKTVYNYLTGTSTSTITSGASVSWSGSITGSHLGTTIKSRTGLGSLTVTVSMNGKSASTSVAVYQQANSKTTKQNISISSFGSYLGAIYYPRSATSESNQTWRTEFSGTFESYSHSYLTNNYISNSTYIAYGKVGANRCFDLQVDTVAYFTSGSSMLESKDYIVDGVTWKITGQSGNLPQCNLTVGYLSHNHNDPSILGYDRYAAHLYWLLSDSSLLSSSYYRDTYFPNIGIDSVGDKLTKTVTISATYKGMTSTATINFEAERVI